MPVVVILILVIAEVGTQQRQVLLADDHRSRLGRELPDMLLLIEAACILQSLIITLKAADTHTMQRTIILDGDVEVADEVGRKVVTGHLIEQLVLVHRIGHVDEHELEWCVSLIAERTGLYRVAVGQHGSTPLPNIADVKRSSTQHPSFPNTIDDHTGHLGHRTLRIVFHHLLHRLQASIGIAAVECAESSYENELITVGSLREAGGRELRIALHLAEPVGLEGGIGGCIERVFQMDSRHGVLAEIGIGEHTCPLALRPAFLQLPHIAVGDSRLSLARIEQEEMIKGVVHVLIGRIVVGQPAQRLLRLIEIVELILEDHAAIIKTVHDDGIAGSHLLFRKWYLFEIIFPLVGIVLRLTGYLFQ